MSQVQHASRDHLLDEALAAMDEGRLDDARRWLDRLLQADSTDRDALQLVAVVEQRCGRLDEALGRWRQLTELEPAWPAWRVNQAVLHEQRGEPVEAVAAYRGALALDAELGAAYLGLGTSLFALGKVDESIAALGEAVRRAPDRPVAHYNLAVVLMSCGRMDEAIKRFECARQVGRGYLPAWFGLAQAHERAENFEAAHEVLAELDALAPGIAEVALGRGNLWLHTQDWPRAEEAFRLALSRRPDYTAARLNLATSLRELERPDEALAEMRVAHSQLTDSADRWSTLGQFLWDDRRFTESLEAFEQACARDPDAPAHHVNLAGACLMSGRLARGWDEYEWRRAVVGFSPSWAAHADALPSPQWRGEPLADCGLLIVHEQGIGDEILFSTCYSALEAAGARLVILVTERLRTLFARSFPRAQVLLRPEGNERPESIVDDGSIDYWTLAGSLPRMLFRDRLPRGASPSHLRVDDAARTVALRSLDALGPGIKIGISWRGGPTGRESRLRSIDIERLAPLFSRAGAQFISLQHGARPEENERLRALAPGRVHILPQVDPQGDLDRFAAWVSALDGVVSVANANVHLAGSLGVPTWAMTRYVPDWRWQAEGESCPWYGSVRLVRQPRAGDWANVVERVAAEIAIWCARPAPIDAADIPGGMPLTPYETV